MLICAPLRKGGVIKPTALFFPVPCVRVCFDTMTVSLRTGLWAGRGAAYPVGTPTAGCGRTFVVTATPPAGKEVTKSIICAAAPSV